MNNELGFITPAIVGLPFNLEVLSCNDYNGFIWDRQTVVVYCNDMDELNEVRDYLRTRHRPNTTSMGNNYRIDIFVNLDYSMHERDPANRNIRIVYCTKELSIEEVNTRFPGCYIVRVKDRKENNHGTPRISRKIPKIFGRKGNA